MFYKDQGHIYRVEELERLPWLDHGFGTRLAGSWTPGPPVWVRQVHSARCVWADGFAGCLGEGDGLVTNSPGRYLTIRTADCIPILLVDESRRAVAAVHAAHLNLDPAEGQIQIVVDDQDVGTIELKKSGSLRVGAAAAIHVILRLEQEPLFAARLRFGRFRMEAAAAPGGAQVLG